MLTYSDLIRDALSRHPSRDAFVHNSRRVTYAEAKELMGRISSELIASRVAPGHGVALLSPNSPEAWLTQAATYLLGARFTGIPVTTSVEDRTYMCDDAEISVLVTAEDLVDDAYALMASSRTVKHVVVLSRGGGVHRGSSEVIVPDLTAGPARESDVALLMYTGGTSGTPKGVELSQRALVQQVYSHFSSWGVPEVPRYLAAGPITHAAVLPILPTLLRGGTVVLMDAFDPSHWLRLVQQERINYGFIVPTMLYAILDQARPEDADLTSLTTVTYGAAPTDPTRVIEAIERVGPVFHQVFGQTEVISVGTAMPSHEHDPRNPGRLASCGRAVVGAKVAILAEDGSVVPPGTVGELAVLTRAAMNGYRNRPDETEDVLQGGWVRTGDMAYQDDEEFVYLVDRKKDLVISGGMNVYSREVEDALGAHPAVAASAVIGVPHPKWGEAVCAVVVAHRGQEPSADELIDFVKRRKGSVQSPKTVVFVDALPVTGTGKVDKKALRAPYWRRKAAESTEDGDSMNNVVVAGVGMTTFGHHPNASYQELAGAAVATAFADARVPGNEPALVYYANSSAGALAGQQSTRGQHALRDTRLGGMPVVNVENACASGSSALHQAWLAVRSGYTEVAVAVGVEKLIHQDKALAFAFLAGALDQTRLAEIREAVPGSAKSVFMDIYAGFATRYMERTGATVEDFARIVVKNRVHGALNPKAQIGQRLTLDEVLDAPVVAGPLTVPMCAPMSDGGAAVVVTTPARASQWGAEPVLLSAAVLGTSRPGEYGRLVPDTARRAYELAGIEPGDIDVLECHDAASPAELIVAEELGLCAPGDGVGLVRVGATALGGRLPINPSGGLGSRGHPVAATGLAQIVELADQLRGRCENRQVTHARTAVAENAGGYMGPDAAVASVTVLQKIGT